MGEMRRTEATGESLRPRKVSSRLTRHSRTASQPIAPSCSSTPGTDGWTCAAHAMPTPLEMSTIKPVSRHDGCSRPSMKLTTSVATGVLALSICTNATEMCR